MTQDDKDLIMSFVNQVMGEYSASPYWCKQEKKIKHLLERFDNSDYAVPPSASPKSCDGCYYYNGECEHDGDCIDYSAWTKSA
jgi:hypothetical protein